MKFIVRICVPMCALLLFAGCGDDGKPIADVKKCLSSAKGLSVTKVPKEKGLKQGVVAIRTSFDKPESMVMVAAAFMDDAKEVAKFKRSIKRSSQEFGDGSKTESGTDGTYVWLVSYGPKSKDKDALISCVKP